MAIDRDAFYANQHLREIEDFRTFEAFYEALADKHRIYYMFFSTGLLQWVRKALQLIPENVNVVLIGAGLVPAEKDWLRSQSGRPAVFLEQAYTDHTIWDFLFRVNRRSFGWIDIDSFVFNPGILADLAERAERSDIVISAAWSYSPANTIVNKQGAELLPEFANTFLLFVHYEAVSTLRSLLDISPRPYLISQSTEAAALSPHRALLERTHEELLHHLYGPCSTSSGSEPYPVEAAVHGGVEVRFIDTLVLFQLFAYYHGFSIAKLPDSRRGQGVSAYHIGGASYYKNYVDAKHNLVSEKEHIQQRKYRRALLMDYCLLTQGEDLPAPYKGLKRVLKAYLDQSSIRVHHVPELLSAMLSEAGLDEHETGLLLGRQTD
ncbi:hypothetical protein [Paenibacillus tarimensis]|uniref:hypothetical protein n=1 Tax=Paenibacillus tarimensis TaxID=416012 RepID=UPI001F1D41E8|nr:hypothetical protein [Paenibacillus tarimensis]MCF2945152.1 hypothetical protein [Paenibacillus tarimensis]